MSAPTNPLDWAEYAEDDSEMAKPLLKKKKPSTTGCCYHSQQSAEKYLKAMLVAKKVNFPKTHDLPALNMICNNSILTGFTTEALTILTDHAVTARYPGDMPTLEDAREAMEVAKTVRKFARQWLGIK